MFQKILLILFPLSLFFSSKAYVESLDLPAQEQPIRIELVYDALPLPGDSLTAGVRFEMDKEWHIYWKNPGEMGFKPEIELTLPEGFSFSAFEWPKPNFFEGAEAFGYKGEATLLTQITPAPGKGFEGVEMGVKVTGLTCSSLLCQPFEQTFTTHFDPAHALPEKIALAKAHLPKTLSNLSVKAEEGEALVTLTGEEKVKQALFFPENFKIAHPLCIALSQDHMLFRLPSVTSSPLEGELCKGVLVVTKEDGGGKEWDESFTLTYSLKKEAPPVLESLSASIPTVSYPKFFAALFFAFLGGVILNLMPCVLPVISFKILSFVKMQGATRRVSMLHGIAFSFGVLVSFWLLAGLLLSFQAYGNAVGWGFQLQEPLFVASLAAVLLIFGLSLFGVFEMGTLVASWAGGKEKVGKRGLFASFFSGVLATAVATPCTGPFLGTAVGFAVTLPPHLALIIFSVLGLGMASPYFLLAAFPQCLRFLPKPGNWMIAFKEMMGFLILATVLWLIWVFSAETNTTALFVLLIAFFFFALGCWIFGTWGKPIQKRLVRFTVGYGLGFASLVVGAVCLFQAASPRILAMGVEERGDVGRESLWEPFSKARIDALKREGKPFFINFTAKWCLICQTNLISLQSDAVLRQFKELGVVLIKADWTKSDAEIAELLKLYGRNSVPLYLFYPGGNGAEALILPQVLTPEIVLDYLSLSR